MSPNETIIHAVLYDRYRFGRYWTNLDELSEETRIKKSTLNSTLHRMMKKGLIDLFRNKGIMINRV